MLRLETGVTFLRFEPVAEWLAVIVVNHSGQWLHQSANSQPLGVTVIEIGRAVLPKQNNPRRINRGSQRLSGNSILKSRFVPGHLIIRREILHFCSEFG